MVSMRWRWGAGRRAARFWVVGALALGLGLVAALPGAAAGTTPAMGPNIVANGSFEQPALATLPPGSLPNGYNFGSFAFLTSLPGWTIPAAYPGTYVELARYATAAAGTQFVELNSNGPSGVMQTLATQPGRTYQLSFDFSPRPGTPAAANVLAVKWNGEVLDTPAISASGTGLADVQWTHYSYTVTAAGSASTLEFDDLGQAATAGCGNCGTFVDHVAVNLLPYTICVLYDEGKAVQSGATVPVKLQVCDAGGNNVSSPSLAVAATGVSRVADGAAGPLNDSGHANPGNLFRYDPTLGATGGYIFNLSTKGLAAGTWQLSFTVGDDPFTYTVEFGVR